MKIGYFADGEWSHRAFEKLIQDSEISIKFVCARFDTEDTTLVTFCQKYDIDYLKVENVNSKTFVAEITEYGCDLLVSMSFNQIFKRDIIKLTKFGIINCHAGKLPSYRGRNILNWALINGEDEFGITVHYVDTGIDTGDIIMQETYPISLSDDYSTLLEKAYVECAKILYKSVCLFKGGSVTGKKQTDFHSPGFYCSQRKIGDEVLDWHLSSKDVFNFVRALCLPGPMSRTYIDGQEVKINKVELVDGAVSYKCITGAILNINHNSFLVKTGDSFVKVTEYETEANLKVGSRFEIK